MKVTHAIDILTGTGYTEQDVTAAIVVLRKLRLEWGTTIDLLGEQDPLYVCTELLKWMAKKP